MRHPPRDVMLFAAGFGTRMGALTAARPKPMIAVAGRPLIDHALSVATRCARKVVNLHYQGDQIAAHLAGRTDVTLAWEREVILDTGGGLRAALPLFPAGTETVFTLNTDAVWTGANPLEQLRAGWGDGMAARLLLLPADRARGRVGPGDFTLLPDGRLRRGGPLVYLGAQIIAAAPVAAVDAAVFSLNRVWDGLIAEGRAFGQIHDGGWCDVGHPAGIGEAEAMLADV